MSIPNPREELILILSVAVKSDAKKRLEDRVTRGLCLALLDDGSDCDKPASKDGVCVSCYNRRRNHILTSRMSEADETRFLASLERKGHRCSYRKRKEIIRKRIQATRHGA